MPREKKETIRAALALAIKAGRKDIISYGVKRFGLRRQTISRYLSDMVKEGLLDATGKTKGRVYALRTLTEKDMEIDLSEQPAEDEVWQTFIAPVVSELPKNVIDICQYGFTEMFNNAVEHSEGNMVVVHLRLTYASIEIDVGDDGVGVFTKIKNGLELASEREAVLELTKGKVTTDPSSHTGEGIFFTSRMFDEFGILSGHLFFCHDAPGRDWFVDGGKDVSGTFVKMEISLRSSKTTRKVFDKFTSDITSPAFDKTEIPVGLLCVEGQNVVSRSQARRLLAGMDKFKEVVLDFKGVKDIGQAFTDEVFRVFQNQNPSISIHIARANKRVKGMIHRAQKTQRD